MQEVRNTIELNIYEDETLEVKKTFKSYGLKWKAFKAIMAKKQEVEKMKDEDDEAAVGLIGDVLKLVFPTITDEDLDDVYLEDLFNTYTQALNISEKMAKNL